MFLFGFIFCGRCRSITRPSTTVPIFQAFGKRISLNWLMDNSSTLIGKWRKLELAPIWLESDCVLQLQSLPSSCVLLSDSKNLDWDITVNFNLISLLCPAPLSALFLIHHADNYFSFDARPLWMLKLPIANLCCARIDVAKLIRTRMVDIASAARLAVQ